MADVILGAALGTALAGLYDAVEGASLGKFKKFKPLLGALRSTLDSIQPLVVKQIGDYNVKLELPNDELDMLEKQMSDGRELVARLSKLRWWNRFRSHYIIQLVELDSSLKGLMNHIVMQQARDCKENLLVAKQTAKQLVEFQELNEKLLRERTLLQEDARELQEKFVLQLQNNGRQLIQFQQLIENMMMQQEARELTNSRKGEILQGAGLVVLLQMLSGIVDQLLKENVTYKPVLRNIKSALDSLRPVIEQAKETYGSLRNGQKRHLKGLTGHLQEGLKLFKSYPKIGTWNIYQTLSYTNKLNQWDDYLQREKDILIGAIAPIPIQPGSAPSRRPKV